uniref:Peptidase A2 domain-containing protein n=1 Tax=Phenylobacterium glaciei TaxID=2803784 RepID=A0A974P219_9CAUL|nr:hypothetical protein JKL49_23840 [Phenylobacterium glaciei]
MKLVLALAALWLAPAPANAAACWFEQGVVVVPASVAGIAGDYILDTGSATTQLHETRAQMEGLPPAFRGEVRVDGVRLLDRAVSVVDLDARTYSFPTPIAGVIGADVLSAYVVDVSFAPCRVEIWRAGKAPRCVRSASCRCAWLAACRWSRPPSPTAPGRPWAALWWRRAWTALRGSMRPWRAPRGQGGGCGALRCTQGPAAGALLGGRAVREPAGRPPAPCRGCSGRCGSPVLSRWRLRFDFPRGRLILRRP